MFTERIDIYISHFFMPQIKMTAYDMYSIPMPSAPLDPKFYHLNVHGPREVTRAAEARRKVPEEA